MDDTWPPRDPNISSMNDLADAIHNYAIQTGRHSGELRVPDKKIRAYFILREDQVMSWIKRGIEIGHGTDLIWAWGWLSDLHSTEARHRFNAWVNPTGTKQAPYELVKDDHRRKITLKVKNEDKLKKLDLDLQSAGVEHDWIWDRGITEFNLEKTITGIVVYPIEEDSVPKCLKKLQLWKVPTGV